MLISFSVENWMCFKDQVRFDLIAGDLEDNHKDHLIELNGSKFLPITAIYGQNGAGKTALFKALKWGTEIILQKYSSPYRASDIKPYFYDCNNAIKFNFEFILNDKGYIFNVTIQPEPSLDALCTIDKSIKDEEGNCVIFDKENNNKLIKLFESIFFISSDLPLSVFPQYDKKEILDFIKNDLNDLLWSLGFENKLYLKQTDELWVKVTELSVIHKNFTNSILINNFAKTLEPTGDNGEAQTYFHMINNITINDENFEIKWDNESSGLKWVVFYLLPFLYQIHCMQNNKSKQAIFIIDGFENSMHPLLTKTIIEAFLNNCNAENRTQLIFTTHDTQFIDKEILRTDEILIIDRNRKPEESDLCSLYEYEGSYSYENLEENYLIGRFGGIPNGLCFKYH